MDFQSSKICTAFIFLVLVVLGVGVHWQLAKSAVTLGRYRDHLVKQLGTLWRPSFARMSLDLPSTEDPSDPWLSWVPIVGNLRLCLHRYHLVNHLQEILRRERARSMYMLIGNIAMVLLFGVVFMLATLYHLKKRKETQPNRRKTLRPDLYMPPAWKLEAAKRKLERLTDLRKTAHPGPGKTCKAEHLNPATASTTGYVCKNPEERLAPGMSIPEAHFAYPPYPEFSTVLRGWKRREREALGEVSSTSESDVKTPSVPVPEAVAEVPTKTNLSPVVRELSHQFWSILQEWQKREQAFLEGHPPAEETSEKTLVEISQIVKCAVHDLSSSDMDYKDMAIIVGISIIVLCGSRLNHGGCEENTCHKCLDEQLLQHFKTCGIFP